MKIFEAPEIEVLLLTAEDAGTNDTSFVGGENELPLG